MFSNPVKNLKSFGIREDMIVADLGAGTGFYSLLLSKMLPLGKVYAVEIQRDFLKTISNKAKESKCENLECLWGDIEKIGGTKIGNKIVDMVIVSNVFFQIDDKKQFVKEISRILKPNGKIIFIDWLPESLLMDRNRHSTMPKDKLQNFIEQLGFKWVKDLDTGEHHYGMIFTSTN